MSIEDDNGVQVAVYKVAYGSKLFLKMMIKLKQTQKFVNGIIRSVIAKKVVLQVLLI